MAKISVYIIAFNEARKIAAAIKSVIDWVDEVIVADSFSTDDTAKIATELGAKVVQIPFHGFGQLRNDALSHCQYEWTFSLDSDERCSVETKAEILSICAKPYVEGASPVAYFIPRRNYLLGRYVKHSGWYPDYRQPQLFRKGKFQYKSDLVHEGYSADGLVAKLQQPIYQVPFENLSQMLNKANRYSTLSANELLKKGKKGGFLKGYLHGSFAFMRHYFFRWGFLDGRAGLAIAISNFVGTFYKYAKLLELQKNYRNPPFL